MILLSGCRNSSSIVDPQSVNQFLWTDIPSSAGSWWEYEVSSTDPDLTVIFEIVDTISDTVLRKETYLESDTVIVDTDTSFIKINSNSFAVRVDGQWKELLRFPVSSGMRWDTFDGDQLTVESTRESVSLPIGMFHNCVKVISSLNRKAYYYAFGLGLILETHSENKNLIYKRLKASSEYPK